METTKVKLQRADSMPGLVMGSALWLPIILLLALVLRIGVSLYLGETVSGLSGAHDEISYDMLGRRYAEGNGMTFPEPWYPWIAPDAPQSYYSFTMSFMLAVVYLILGYHPLLARLIMAVVGTVVVWLIYCIARELFNPRVARIALLLAAVYAYLIFYSAVLVTEMPFTAAILLSIYLVLQLSKNPGAWRWLALGLALAVAVLFRMAVVFYLPFLLGWLFSHLPQGYSRGWLALPVMVVVAAVTPLTWRNYQIWGEFVLLETQFGHVFWNGNHPDHHGEFHPSDVFPIPDEVLALGNEARMTNALLRLGVENVVSDPVHFIRLTLRRLREFFTFWPTADSEPVANILRLASFGWLAPLALAGLIGQLYRWRQLAPLYLFVLIHTGVYAISWTMIRYRIPIDPILIMFGASVLDSLWAKITGRAEPVAVPQPVGDTVAQ